MPIIHDIHTITIHDLVQSIADQTREYDGTIESLEREFPFAFDHREYELRSHYPQLDREIKDIQRTRIDDLAYAIRYTKPDDTTLRDKHNSILNTLTHAYGIHLVRCPNCSTPIDRPENQQNLMCPLCSSTFPTSTATDLFF